MIVSCLDPSEFILMNLHGGPAKVRPTYNFAGNVWYLGLNV